jgi:hypothetical protein
MCVLRCVVVVVMVVMVVLVLTARRIDGETSAVPE